VTDKIDWKENTNPRPDVEEAWRLSCERYGIDPKRPLDWGKVPVQKLLAPENV
jgi:hypothetical protein